jgi:hypothetical protein
MRTSRAMFEKGGCTVEAARTLALWGKLDHANDRKEDARERFDQAARLFEGAGLTWEIDKFRAVLTG